MSLSPKLDLRHSQSMVMTPQLMQSIKLLQMAQVELDQFIDLEIEKNPLLERVEPVENEGADHAPISEETAAEDPNWFKTAPVSDAEHLSSAFDTSMDNVFPDDPGRYDAIGSDMAAQWKSSSGNNYVSNADHDMDQIAAGDITLSDHVHEQIGFAFASASERFIAAELAGSLDENGYLRLDLQETALRLGVSEADIERILAVLQGFEPVGLFARDLRECLAIQLRVKDRFDPAMQALIDNLALLAKRDFVALQRLCGVDQADLADMLAEVRLLDPKPGALFETDVASPIIPDVLVSRSAATGWDLELNPAAMPRILINHQYAAHVSASASTQDKAFLSDCLQTASWLVRSLDQRARTILKVSQEIVRQQDGFLNHGVTHLKPLNLRMVAEAIGMHESTISRVTSNKFMVTPRGTFELRYFFNASIASAEGGEAHSSTSVRHRIRQMIDAEHHDKVLSDDAIVDALKKAGVEIARRTVAKYREAMNIASSVQRRREKRTLVGDS